MSVILHFGDVQVTSMDLDSLAPKEWVGDGVIQFYYEFLEKSVCLPHAKEMLLLQPAVAFLIANSQDPRQLRDALPPDLVFKKVIFIPINNSNGGQGGGSHWSLLCFFRPLNTYYYYDSMGVANLDYAKQAMRSLHDLVGDQENPSLVCIETPVQVNAHASLPLVGYDCGVYVIAITELLCLRIIDRDFNALEKPQDLSLWKLDHCISPHSISEKRTLVRNLISELAEKWKH
ncbi:hypothetical protein BASA50_007366 [Batrachochytrium salamandrivorans]|uniref:Ubiquitin-like protease family profile domain-containing protein n=1 Tax=Batrachochytrium salamandrivorans TaxID=1357716 RepID=A0ABQ8FA58_9FUNG|nr:hypothetical protein BASA60_010406 [Batrachochytrium salamandrivorans]KAH6578700.1 hypothetical protein BASA61_000165 [Batrachochytrium salamandrivorans]KAH6593415.1 hypothetical protein BASA50_007366 [Batrachochytrium salamandrivorans]